MYNHSNQYRCIIIRGKSKRDLDNLLPAYALVIDDICPCPQEEFERKFNSAFSQFLKNVSGEDNKKTLDNHRTEIAGKLFGMYYLNENGMFYASDRTKKYLADNDQPAFFKDLCYKMQFPNGMNKIQTTQPYFDLHISIRQFPFIIKCLQLAETRRINLNISDIGYYILNSLDVLQGKAAPEEVLEQVSNDKQAGIQRKIYVPGKASSYTMQHIREQINYLELANLVLIDEDKNVILNHKENRCLNIFASQCGKDLLFDVYSYNLSTQDERNMFYSDWDYYYAGLSEYAGEFETKIEALVGGDMPEKETTGQEEKSSDKIEIGDEGEKYIFEYEKNRVAKFNPRLANKVLHLGKTKGLGYDIQSVIAEHGDKAEFVKYIEVKSTKRVTAPDLSDNSWIDTVNITRNEWVAASQHGEYYSIYRVYFAREGIIVYLINNVHKKEDEQKIQIVPLTYRLDFNSESVDSVINIGVV